MKVIFLIVIGFSILNADFIKSEDIVTDSVSGLEWQDDTVGSTMTWENAIFQCEDLTLGGHSDWRLPSINELKSIVDRSKVSLHIVDGFENTSSYYYWSSTTYVGSKGHAWVVDFDIGYVYGHGTNKDGSYYVRCVRIGQ